MTTFTLKGARFTETGENISAVATATLKIVASDNYLLKYAFLPPVPTNDSAEVDLSPARGTDYQIRMNGGGFNDGGASVVEVTWGGGKKTQLLILDFGDAQGSYSFFELSGAALPTFTTVSQAKNWFNGVTKLNPQFGGDFGVNTGFDLRDMSAFSSLTQNDVIMANGRYDQWEGAVINTGIGDDKVFAVSANDTIELGSGNDTARGGSGNDTIRGGIDNDVISGESGKDKLLGGGGRDALHGGTGDDTMTGGAGPDRFIFTTDCGADLITDFAAGIDRVDLSGFAPITGLADMNANHIRTRDGNVYIDDHAGNVVVLVGVTENELHQAGYASNFIF